MAKRNAAASDESDNTSTGLTVDDVVNKATGGAVELEEAIRATAEHFEGLPDGVSKAKVAAAMKSLYGIKRARKA